MNNAFKAFKARVPMEWSPHPHNLCSRKAPPTHIGACLGKCNQTVMHWNTPTVRGMLQQVKRLVVIETEEMFKDRKKGLEEQPALRSPIVVNHPAASQ